MQTGYRDNFATTAAGCDEGTNANTIKTSNPCNYSLNGFGYLKAATDNLPFSAGHTALAANQRCAFFFCVDAAGNVTTLQSQIVTPSPAGDQRAAAEIPNPSDKVVMGGLVVTTGAAGAFTPNTTDLSAAGVTYTKFNFCGDYGATIPL